MSSSPTRLSGSAALNPSGPPRQHPAEATAKGTRSRRRTDSSSSASSAVSAASEKSEDQFVFSPQRSPSHGSSSFFASSRGLSSLASSAPGSGQPSVENSPQPSRDLSTNSPSSTSKDSPTPRSKPIAIELPPSVSRKIASSSVYTPIEPLSGRGDISGGYFPLHEDPNKRISRPHPFHADSEEAESHVDSYGRPLQGSEPSSTTAPRQSLSKPAMSDLNGHHPMINSVKMSLSRGNTPVTSYVPSGLHEAPMPVGKYYPSNYEAAKSRQNSSQTHRTPRSSLRTPSFSDAPSSVKSDTVVPQFNRTDSSRARSDSDAKRRLQQYQRDMVAQATQAARQLTSGQAASATLAAKHGVPMQKFQIGSHRPVSPRLQPLGSPGPVTPMELEGQGGDGGYLTRGRPVPSPDAGRESQAVARAMKAEDERKRREGRGSPVVEAGGFGF